MANRPREVPESSKTSLEIQNPKNDVRRAEKIKFGGAKGRKWDQKGSQDGARDVPKSEPPTGALRDGRGLRMLCIATFARHRPVRRGTISGAQNDPEMLSEMILGMMTN